MASALAHLTLTMLDSAQTGSFDTVGVLHSTDQGTTWSTPVGLVNPTEFLQGSNYNAFASAAIQPSGAVVGTNSSGLRGGSCSRFAAACPVRRHTKEIIVANATMMSLTRLMVFSFCIGLLATDDGRPTERELGTWNSELAHLSATLAPSASTAGSQPTT